MNDIVHLSNGMIVRICSPRAADQDGIECLLTSSDAVTAGALPAPAADDVIVAIGHWEFQVVAHAAWRRLPGARAAATLTVAQEFASTPLAAHMLVRLARLADAERIPTLIVAPLEADDRLAPLLRDIFRAEPAAGGGELRTCDWPQALARIPRGIARPCWEPGTYRSRARGARDRHSIA